MAIPDFQSIMLPLLRIVDGRTDLVLDYRAEGQLQHQEICVAGC